MLESHNLKFPKLLQTCVQGLKNLPRNLFPLQVINFVAKNCAKMFGTQWAKLVTDIRLIVLEWPTRHHQDIKTVQLIWLFGHFLVKWVPIKDHTYNKTKPGRMHKRNITHYHFQNFQAQND